MGEPVYLDANATVAPLSEVIDAIAGTMRSAAGNPSSAHSMGAEARTMLEEARDSVCELVPGLLPEGLIFTSGGTEANNAVVASFEGVPGLTVVTTAAEHPSVLAPARRLAAQGAHLIVLPLRGDGRVDPGEVERACAAAPGPVLLAIQAANSETGVVQPVGQAAAAARRTSRAAFVLVDAAQAVGRVLLSLETVDAVTFSAHKLHGPAGIGALGLIDSDDDRVRPLILGGGQERGLRSGTQNVPGAVGFGVAAAMRARTFAECVARLAAMRDRFEAAVLAAVPGARVNGAGAPRVPNTANIRFLGFDGEAMLARLDAAGVMCSKGSACSSARPEPSPTLMAMGLSEADAHASLRFSFSVLNTEEEVMRAAEAVAHAARELAGALA